MYTFLNYFHVYVHVYLYTHLSCTCMYTFLKYINQYKLIWKGFYDIIHRKINYHRHCFVCSFFQGIWSYDIVCNVWKNQILVHYDTTKPVSASHCETMYSICWIECFTMVKQSQRHNHFLYNISFNIKKFFQHTFTYLFTCMYKCLNMFVFFVHLKLK